MNEETTFTKSEVGIRVLSSGSVENGALDFIFWKVID